MKFCKSCGAQLDDAATFCTNCGASQAEQTQNAVPTYVQPQSVAPEFAQAQNYGQYAAPKKSKKGLILGLSIGGGVAVILAVVLLIVLLGGGDSGSQANPKDLAKAFLSACNSADENKLEKLFVEGRYRSSDAGDMIEVIKEGRELGGSISLSFGKEEEKKSYTEYYDMYDSVHDGDLLNDVKEVCNYSFTYKISASYQGQSMNESETAEMTCVKMNGKWYIYYIDID